MAGNKLVNGNNTRREMARQVRQWRIDEFHQELKAAGIYRAFIVYENGQFQLSHPKVLQPLQAFFELSQDFANHEGIFIGREDGLDSLFLAFVHDTRRGLSQGGLRFAPYQSMAELLVDGLRLSQGMTRKNALAGLSWGGGKGIMTLPSIYQHPKEFKPGPERQAYFEAYGRFVASLGGVYYTAEDVGTNTSDMAALLSQNRFTTCIPASHGGSGNPSPFTARGVLRAMQAAWLSLSGNEHLQGVKVAVQGTGNVGAPLIRYLDDLGAEVYIADVNTESLEALKAERPRLQVIVDPDAIFDVAADIFAPCAIGAQVNLQTIPRLKVKLVCGAANNILKEPEADAERLRQRGIAFVPDFVCNRMGIINCADEWQGYLAEDIRQAAERLFPDTLRVFKYARNRYSTTTQAANDLADMAASELHPMLGHRGRRIIDHLMTSHWHQYHPQHPSSPPDNIVEPLFMPRLDEPQIRVRWEREQAFCSNSPHTLAATPITTASSPDLGSFLSALLLDVKARALDQFQNNKPQRILGSEHGGLALQIAVEQALPYEREDIGRSEFLSLCRDFYNHHDAAVREQLQQLGIGFDHDRWLTPMVGSTRKAIEQAYDFMQRAHLIYTLDAIGFHCPRCESIRVASDVLHSHRKQEIAYRINLTTSAGQVLQVEFLYPEYILNTIALAVHPDGPWAHLAGQSVREPLQGRDLPIISSRFAETELEWVSPLALKRHEKIAREQALDTRIQIFNQKGQVCVPGFENLTREAVREAILERLGTQVEAFSGSWTVDDPYCARCESRVIPRYGDQTFVEIQEAVNTLKAWVNQDRITFSQDFWKKKMLSILGDLNLWCISRQYWWGNEMPGSHQDEVLSTWFSLAIWTLCGAGWPDNPKPPMIDEVFVDGELFFRWVIPTQLAALIITGRPIFRHIHVHGTLNVVERALKARAEIPDQAPDEERFLYYTVRRPMRYRLGNLIEPTTLIQRYGADALRLGYLLSMDSQSPEVVTLSEDRLKQARRIIRRLVSKVTGLLHLCKEPLIHGEPRALDHWLIAHLEKQLEPVAKACLENRFSWVAQDFVNQVNLVVKYINTVVERRSSGDLGAARASLALALKFLQRGYSPLCPFVLEKLSQILAQRSSAEDPQPQINHPGVAVLQALACEPESAEPLPAYLMQEKAELARFFGADLN